MNTGFRTTAHVGRDSAVVLPGCGVQNIGIARIDHDIRHPGPLAATERLRPSLTAVSGHKEASITAGGP